MPTSYNWYKYTKGPIGIKITVLHSSEMPFPNGDGDYEIDTSRTMTNLMLLKSSNQNFL